MRCRLCDHSGPGELLPLGEWADGPSDQGAWCKCCLGQLIDDIVADRDNTLESDLALHFLVTLAQRPGRYVREVPVDTSGWAGGFPCWHPTNCRTLAKHEEKLKKSRSKYFSKVSRRVLNLGCAYYPFSYDQIDYPSPYPYTMTSYVAVWVLERISPEDYPPNAAENLG
jgi:hypothetical protein